MEDGLVAGYPVVDIRVTLYDGKFHSVDSSDMAFQIAGGLALDEAAAQADIVLLEPILELEVLVPDEYVGDILGDLSSRRGRVVGTDPVGTGKTLVRATAPEAEVIRYAIDLRSMTRGKGSFARRFSLRGAAAAHGRQGRRGGQRPQVSEDGGRPCWSPGCHGRRPAGWARCWRPAARWCTSTSPSTPSTRRAAPPACCGPT